MPSVVFTDPQVASVGLTEAGARATASHTASLATSTAVWDGVVRQAGAVPAESLDDTIDVLKALLHCKPTTGRGMGLMAMTGGQSVSITDAFVRAGLEVPLLTTSSYEKLGAFFNIIGGSYRNPLDMGGTSADIAPIRDYRAGLSFEREVGGIPVRLPMLDIHTIGAGGGSIAWFDRDGLLKVGPTSAGADPGPACYGHGGEARQVFELTVNEIVSGSEAPAAPAAVESEP